MSRKGMSGPGATYDLYNTSKLFICAPYGDYARINHKEHRPPDGRLGRMSDESKERRKAALALPPLPSEETTPDEA